MKQIKRGKIPGFTVAEHLKVQEQIEQRAYELWLARGSRQNRALENWVRAEREVLEDFIEAKRTLLISAEIVEWLRVVVRTAPEGSDDD